MSQACATDVTSVRISRARLQAPAIVPIIRISRACAWGWPAASRGRRASWTGACVPGAWHAVLRGDAAVLVRQARASCACSPATGLRGQDARVGCPLAAMPCCLSCLRAMPCCPLTVEGARVRVRAALHGAHYGVRWARGREQGHGGALARGRGDARGARACQVWCNRPVASCEDARCVWGNAHSMWGAGSREGEGQRDKSACAGAHHDVGLAMD